jgi:hypothetical protein
MPGGAHPQDGDGGGFRERAEARLALGEFAGAEADRLLLPLVEERTAQGEGEQGGGPPDQRRDMDGAVLRKTGEDEPADREIADREREEEPVAFRRRARASGAIVGVTRRCGRRFAAAWPERRRPARSPPTLPRRGEPDD